MKKIAFTFVLVFSFTLLQAHVNLVYPEGGETFNPGQTVTIEWEILIPHNTDNWDLYFSMDGGNTWDELRLDIGVDTLMYDWIVPEVGTEQGRIKVVMDNSGSNYEDESDDFSITGSSGISFDQEIPAFRIYPNPAREFVCLESEQQFQKAEIRLIDLQGNTLGTYTGIRKNTGNKWKIPLQSLAPGIYGLYFTLDDKAWLEKIVVY